MDSPGSAQLQQRLPGGAVQLRGVGFAYPSVRDRPVLQDINLLFPPGMVHAVIGQPRLSRPRSLSLVSPVSLVRALSFG